MRKIALLILLLSTIASSSIACNRNGSTIDNTKYKDESSLQASKGNDEDANDNTENQTFTAEVIDTEGALLITPDKESVERSSSDRILVATRDAEIIDDKGKTADIDIFKPGDRIRITYNGLIAESYPAQITAGKVELIEHNHIIDGFFALIDDVYQADSGLNGGISMIAFDTSEWTVLSETETAIILATVGKEYGFEVVEGTFDELAEQKLIDKKNLYFENGILIEVGNIEINKDKDKISCTINKWRSGLGAIGWDATAKFKKGTWEITRKNMWIS